MPTTEPSASSSHELQLDTPPNSVALDDESGCSSSSTPSPTRSSEDSNSCDGLTVDTTRAALTQNSQLPLHHTPTSSPVEPCPTTLSPPNSEESCDLTSFISEAENNSSRAVAPELELKALNRRQVFSTGSSSEDSCQGYYDEVVATDVDTESCDDGEDDGDCCNTDCGSDDEGKSKFSSLWRNESLPLMSFGERPEESELCLPASETTSPSDFLSDEGEKSLSSVDDEIPSVEAYVEVHTSDDFEMGDDVSRAEGCTYFSTVDTQVLDRDQSPNSRWSETFTATAFYGTDPVDVNVVFSHGRQEEFCRGIPTPDIVGEFSASETQLNMEMEPINEDAELDSTDSMTAGNDVEVEFDGVTRFLGKPLIELVLETHQPMDTIITLSDGKLGAHRLVLSAASLFLKELLIEQDARKTATLILPDISKQTMSLLLTLAYTGNVAFTLAEEADLFSAVSMLLFGENFNTTVHQLPPRPKPLPPPPPVPQKKDIKIESTWTGENRNSAFDTCGSSSWVSRVQCSFCPLVFIEESELQVHIDSVHKTGKTWATFGEVRIVSYCHGCNTQWKTLDRAQKCLLSHGLSRCWVCFDVFGKTGLRDHYMTNHCDESSRLDAHNTFIRCRWCPKKVNIKSSIAYISMHAVTHIRQNQTVKGGKGKTAKVDPEGDDDEGEVIAAFEKVKTLDGQSIYLRYKTLKGEETLVMEELSASLRPPPSPPRTKYVVDDNKKCHFDISNFTPVFIQLNRLPKNIEDRIFRRDPIPPIPASVSSASKTHPSEQVAREKGVKERLDALPVSDPGSPQPISIVNIQDLMDEEDTGNIQKRRKRSVVTPFRLFTQNWGHVNLLAQNLSKQDFKGFPENGSLIVGRDSSVDIWNQVEAMKLKGMDMIVLRMTSFDATHFSELFSYLSSEDRVGIISNARVSKVMEIILVPLTPENHARMEKLFGAPELEDSVQLESLVAIVVKLKSPVTPGIKRSTRGRKRRLDSPQSPVVVKTVSASSALKPSRQSNRKRPKVIPLIQLEDGEMGPYDGKDSPGLIVKTIDCTQIQVTPQMEKDILFVPVDRGEPDPDFY